MMCGCLGSLYDYSVRGRIVNHFLDDDLLTYKNQKKTTEIMTAYYILNNWKQI